jgi:hypothetical protein
VLPEPRFTGLLAARLEPSCSGLARPLRGALHRRIVHSIRSNSAVDQTVRRVYDQGHIALEFDGAGSLADRYLHGPDIDQVLADEQHADEK